MIRIKQDIDTVLPRQEFILTTCGAFVAYIRRDHLLEVASRCTNPRVHCGALVMDYKSFFIRIKIS